MDLMTAKFQRLGIDNAPGQEDRQSHTELELRGEPLPGPAVNFSHGDVDAHQPIPGSLETFIEGYKKAAVWPIRNTGVEMTSGRKWRPNWRPLPEPPSIRKKN